MAAYFSADLDGQSLPAEEGQLIFQTALGPHPYENERQTTDL